MTFGPTGGAGQVYGFVLGVSFFHLQLIVFLLMIILRLGYRVLLNRRACSSPSSRAFTMWFNLELSFFGNLVCCVIEVIYDSNRVTVDEELKTKT